MTATKIQPVTIGGQLICQYHDAADATNGAAALMAETGPMTELQRGQYRTA